MSKLHKLKPLKPLKKKKKYTRTSKNVGTSITEKDFKLFLNSIGIDVEEQHQVNYKFYDFIIKNTKILIEFNGDYWHANPKVYPNGPINKMQKKSILNDAYKRALAKMGGYELIVICEKDFNENKEEIKEKLKKYANIKPLNLDLYNHLKEMLKETTKKINKNKKTI